MIENVQIKINIRLTNIKKKIQIKINIRLRKI
jgi:hypothetical protein